MDLDLFQGSGYRFPNLRSKTHHKIKVLSKSDYNAVFGGLVFYAVSSLWIGVRHLWGVLVALQRIYAPYRKKYVLFLRLLSSRSFIFATGCKLYFQPIAYAPMFRAGTASVIKWSGFEQGEQKTDDLLPYIKKSRSFRAGRGAFLCAVCAPKLRLCAIKY